MEIKINENSCIIDGVEYVKKEQTPKWLRDGTILSIDRRSGDTIVFILEILADDFMNQYAYYNITQNELHPFGIGFIYEDLNTTRFRPATTEEAKLLHSKLAENGKRWNAEKKCLEDLPKPLKEGDIAIFYDYDITEALIAKYVRAERSGHYSNHGWFKHAIPFKSIEQYKQFITVHES